MLVFKNHLSGEDKVLTYYRQGKKVLVILARIINLSGWQILLIYRYRLKKSLNNSCRPICAKDDRICHATGKT